MKLELALYIGMFLCSPSVFAEVSPYCTVLTEYISPSGPSRSGDYPLGHSVSDRNKLYNDLRRLNSSGTSPNVYCELGDYRLTPIQLALIISSPNDEAFRASDIILDAPVNLDMPFTSSVYPPVDNWGWSTLKDLSKALGSSTPAFLFYKNIGSDEMKLLIQKMFKIGFSLKTVNLMGENLYHSFANMPEVELTLDGKNILDLLYEAGVDPSKRSANSEIPRTPLEIAMGNHYRILPASLDWYLKHVDPSVAGADGLSALELAVKRVGSVGSYGRELYDLNTLAKVVHRSENVEVVFSDKKDNALSYLLRAHHPINSDIALQDSITDELLSKTKTFNAQFNYLEYPATLTLDGIKFLLSQGQRPSDFEVTPENRYSGKTGTLYNFLWLFCMGSYSWADYYVDPISRIVRNTRITSVDERFELMQLLLKHGAKPWKSFTYQSMSVTTFPSALEFATACEPEDRMRALFSQYDD